MKRYLTLVLLLALCLTACTPKAPAPTETAPPPEAGSVRPETPAPVWGEQVFQRDYAGEESNADAPEGVVVSLRFVMPYIDPAFTIKTAVVSAQWPGASVTDTTHLVTDVLEKKLQETPWLDYIESETRAGQTVIYINLRDDTPAHNVPAIWYQIRKKMQDIAPSLPEGAQGPSVNDEFDDTYGTIYGFIPDGYSLEEVRQRVETIDPP